MVLFPTGVYNIKDNENFDSNYKKMIESRLKHGLDSEPQVYIKPEFNIKMPGFHTYVYTDQVNKIKIIGVK